MYNSMIMLPQTLFFYNGLISRLNWVSHAKGFIEQIDVLHGDIWRARGLNREISYFSVDLELDFAPIIVVAILLVNCKYNL